MSHPREAELSARCCGLSFLEYATQSLNAQIFLRPDRKSFDMTEGS
jgi:hypothetical protein